MRRNAFFLTLSILLSFYSSSLFAQDGWALIKQNKQREAATAFRKTLERDSTDYEALLGLLYLSDIEQSDRDFVLTVGRLLRNHSDDDLFYLYGDYYETEASEILRNKRLSYSSKMEAMIYEAYRNRFQRDFETHKQKLDNLLNPWQWYYIGPFENINSYGHVREYEVEKDDFDTAKVYKNRKKLSLKWFSPEHTHPGGVADFTHYLPGAAGVYYATTFFKSEKKQRISLQFSRTEPIKVWLDGELLFENQDHSDFRFNSEKVELDLPEGTHRLLIKSAIGSFFDRKEGSSEYELLGIDNREAVVSYMKSMRFSRNFSTRRYETSYNSYPPLSAFKELPMTDVVYVRLTDSAGRVIPIEYPEELPKENILKRKYDFTVFREETITDLHRKIQKAPEKWYNYYLLLEACQRKGIDEEAEEFFVKAYEKNRNNTFFKFLLANVFNTNGKSDRSFIVLSDVDREETPVLSLYFKDLNELDPEHQEEEYLEVLNTMHGITPSNLTVIRKTLEYFDEKGKDEEKKNFGRKVVREFPEYEILLRRYLDDDYKPADSDINSMTAKERKKHLNEAAKRRKEIEKAIKKRFMESDYVEMIKKYKAEAKPETVLAFYDEAISILPHDPWYRREKAKYLFNQERYEEAVEEFKALLRLRPYDAEVYEYIGDLYKDRKMDSIALAYYQKSKDLSRTEYSGFYSEDVSSKIEKIAGQKKLKNKFTTPEISEMLKDKSWKEKYADEESVILAYTSDIIMDDDGYVNLYSRFAVQILTEAGANTWTEYNFEFMGGLDYVKVLKENGTEVVPDRRGSYVVFRNLKPGDRIIAEGSADWFSESEFGAELSLFNYFMFQSPIHYAKLEVAVPEGQHLGFLHHKLRNNIRTEKRDGYNFHIWEYKNLPRFVYEEALVDRYDPYANIKISTIPDWGRIVEWYTAKTYRKTELDYETREILDSLVNDEMSDREKVVRIYNFITKEINYSHNSLLQTGYIPKTPALTCSSGIGDCKDVSTLMIAMLQEVGIKAYYVLVKTNSYFHQKTMPGNYFDHVITAYELDGNLHYADPTTDFYPFYVLNENDIGAWGLLIKEGEKEIFQLPNHKLDPNKNLVLHKINARLDEGKKLEIDVESSFSGLSGGYWRESLHSLPRDNFKNLILGEMGKGVFTNLNIRNYAFLNQKSITQPLKARFEFQSLNYSDKLLDIPFLKIPFMVSIDAHVAILSPERQNTLNLDDVTTTEPTIQRIKLSFPKGTSLKVLPDNIEMENRFVKYTMKFERTTEGISIEKYHEFRKVFIEPGDFEEFKKVYLRLLDFENTKIVLTKDIGITERAK